MIEILIICCVIFIILTFFYKQAIHEFRINQIEWSQRETSYELLQERVPLIIRNIPIVNFWTTDDILARDCYKYLDIFKEISLSSWLSSVHKKNTVIKCPWTDIQAEKIATVSGINIWANKWMNPTIIHPFLRWWLRPTYYCWAGNIGLRKTYATWTCLFPVDGEITVTIMTETSENELPVMWHGCFPSELTVKDTPFLADLKFIDIKLRTGTCLFMPAHWFISWVSNTNKLTTSCTISYHTPISWLSNTLGNKNPRS
jgi:hypothetical protein